MSSFIVSGARPLFGEIRAGGCKNAVLPVVFATVATRGRSVIKNAPDIIDLDVAVELVRSLGASVERRGTDLYIDSSSLTPQVPDPALLSRIRASTYLLGASLAAFGRVSVAPSGGCSFAARPIDLHIFAFEQMGARFFSDELTLSEPRDARIEFPKVSVGATANALILASALPTVTELSGYAREPHISTLIEFLSRAGAEIVENGDTLTVRGAHLHGAEIEIPPDPIETGTYALISLLSDGRVSVVGSEPSEISMLTSPLISAGARMKSENGAIRLFGTVHTPIAVAAAPYPAFPTDLQPPLCAALGMLRGGVVSDTVFPTRFGYLDGLSSFGLVSERSYGTATVYPSRLHGAEASAPDLRGGAALLLSALFAKGESVIHSSELIRRGYSDIVKKLRNIGADIYEV